MKYLAFDVETGGLDPKTASILTAYFVALDENFNFIEELDLKIKGEKGEPYSVTGEALTINKINLVELHHDAKSVSKGLASVMLSDFINKHSEGGKNPLIPIGHNVPFDIGFVNHHLLPKPNWDRYVSYHLLDTAVVANFLRAKGTFPKDMKFSLGSLAQSLGLNVTKGLHSAKVDTAVCVGVLQAMLKK